MADQLKLYHVDHSGTVLHFQLSESEAERLGAIPDDDDLTAIKEALEGDPAVVDPEDKDPEDKDPKAKSPAKK